LIRELLEAVDLTRFAKALVGTFSGGMRRRLEIARGLVHSPRILFLDEPTTGLDPVSRTNVWEMIDKLQEQSHLTILLTTHYMDEADKLCDRIAIVDHGKLAALDTPVCRGDRKSTRLNSSHVAISYAVFCLKKKKK